MLIFTKIADLQAFLNETRKSGKTLGFVPTMGALHPGHVSLTRISKSECDLTLCSIFVNPTQFNDKKDLERYPRTPEKDIELLASTGCDAVFLPLAEEIYPTEEVKIYNFDHLSTTLEGEHRPGHFNGVAQVVQRFFEIIQPDAAFFGSKDYQQVMVIRELVRQMNSPIRIVACPILREEDGLAMSSRNALLNKDERAAASRLPQIMQAARGLLLNEGIEAAREFVKQQTSAEPLLKLDYYEVCEADTLKIVNALTPGLAYITLIACFSGRIRLIDNLPV